MIKCLKVELQVQVEVKIYIDIQRSCPHQRSHIKSPLLAGKTVNNAIVTCHKLLTHIQ